MAQGRLRVTIVEAAKLADKDTTDFNDSYVEVYVDEKKKHTTSVLKDVERPVWNESFDLYVFHLSSSLIWELRCFLCPHSDLWPSQDYLYINVYDEDEGKKPDLIGSAKVDLDEVLKKGKFDEWVKLPGFLGFGSRGDVHIRMTFERASMD